MCQCFSNSFWDPFKGVMTESSATMTESRGKRSSQTMRRCTLVQNSCCRSDLLSSCPQSSWQWPIRVVFLSCISSVSSHLSAHIGWINSCCSSFTDWLKDILGMWARKLSRYCRCRFCSTLSSDWWSTPTHISWIRRISRFLAVKINISTHPEWARRICLYS